ncbi:MAG TPA: hypothetical protein VGL77_10380 [Armatimonadota bacterium]|jgi:hypothetical protein
MFNIVMRFKVIDYPRWKAEFDADDSWRRTSGEQDYRVFRDADDPTLITVMLGWESMDTGQLFISSPLLRRKLQDGGVIGEPNYFLVNEVGKAA